MAATVLLPTNKEDLAKAIKKLMAAGAEPRNLRMVQWMISYHYLQGARDFSNPNWKAGTISVNRGRQNSVGFKDFRYDEVVTRYQTELGRMLKIDLRPRVKKSGMGLDALRKAGIAQIALDNLAPQEVVERCKAEILPLLLTFGAAGLSTWVDRHGRSHPEVSPPWELLPIPGEPLAAVDGGGLMRVRWMSLDRLKEFEMDPNAPGVRRKWGEMEYKEVPYGTVPRDENSPVDSHSLYGLIPDDSVTRGKSSGKKSGQTQKFVQIAETWIDADDSTLARYILYAGGKIVADFDYTQATRRPPMPIKKINYIDTGSFYGRGFVELLIPVNDEVEALLSRLFENIQELDMYGIALLPTNMGIDVSQFRATGKPKYLSYEPDYNTPTIKPDRIAPVNTGALPGKIAELAMGLMSNLANQPAMLQGEAPGRVDSARGLGMLFETSSIPLTGPAYALATGFTTVYRAMLELAKEKWSNLDISAISMLDDSVIGLVLNATTGALDTEANALPLPEEVDISVVSALPVSPEQQKAELANSLKLQVITPREYRLLARKQGLDLPVGNDAEWENHRNAVMENVVLFGDGKTPGKAIVSEHDMHTEHVETLNTFRAKPEFRFASPEVRESFATHYMEHLRGMGTGYPESMPYPEDMAEVEQFGPTPEQGGPQGPPGPQGAGGPPPSF